MATQILENLVGKAYFQWTRHLTHDPDPVVLVVGDYQGTVCGGHNRIGCRIPEPWDVVMISDDWVIENYVKLYSGDASGAVEGMFTLLTHEAGHQFNYGHPSGTGHGCGDGRCHAPDGSGSVISYDHTKGRSIRYHVTREDIRHIPGAAWKGGDTDSCSVSKSSGESSIDRWGVSIDHRFVVDGQTSPGELFGGNLSIGDRITGTGWIAGAPSTDVSLTGSATWSGEDNFLGVNLDDGQPGALPRADANLRHTFGNAPNLTLQVNNFEAHYSAEELGNVCVNRICRPGRINADATWHGRSGDFTYSMDCTSGGCSDAQAEAKWHADGAGDPAGWVGGVVNDQGNGYVGSFAAERD